MVRWNAGTEHVMTQRQTLSPAGSPMRFMMVTKERVNEAMPDPMLAQLRHSHRRLTFVSRATDGNSEAIHFDEKRDFCGRGASRRRLPAEGEAVGFFPTSQTMDFVAATALAELSRRQRATNGPR